MKSSVLTAPPTVRGGAALTGAESNSAAASKSTGHASAMVNWHVTAVVFASTCVIVGLIWDISWHMTIGRDTFWTPAHMAIYTGGIVAGMASGFEVLRRSFFSQQSQANDSVRIWKFFDGPLGGWLCIWGAVAMLTSAPFDDWWHNAYGLDVQILSPPHSILALGFLAILIGTTLLAAARQTREKTPASGLVVAYACGLVLIIASIMFYEFEERILMHSGIFYEVVAAVFPLYLVASGIAVRVKWPATTVALVYTVGMLIQLWILPLFAATPLLGPIRQPTTHMVPLNFPLMVWPAAFVIDLILRKTGERGPWLRALMLGSAFAVAFTAVQWPLADFLMSAASRNALFHTGDLPYMVPTDSMMGTFQFVGDSARELFVALCISLGLAVLSSRVGISCGQWLRAVRR